MFNSVFMISLHIQYGETIYSQLLDHHGPTILYKKFEK